MDNKQDILNAIRPRAVLKAMTPAAEEAVPHNQLTGGYIAIRDFPFKMGRESRVRVAGGKEQMFERPKLGGRLPNNDLYLIDGGKPLNISREHCLIEAGPTGYQLLDRGSACGISINGQRVGGHDTGGSSALADGDEIAIGSDSTPYRYRFITLDDASE
ncbi:MAG: FHA domain-containing protein [Mariprofundus sp.]